MCVVSENSLGVQVQLKRKEEKMPQSSSQYKEMVCHKQNKGGLLGNAPFFPILQLKSQECWLNILNLKRTLLATSHQPLMDINWLLIPN